MLEITDVYMRNRLETAREYPLVLLKAGPAYLPRESRPADQQALIWEHGRRNMKLSAEGKMAVVGPVGDGYPIVGMCIFSVPEAEARELMDGDGAVQAGLLICEFMTFYGFPGDGLAAG
jgi:hypothetical protein